jgi:hypothetical protein
VISSSIIAHPAQHYAVRDMTFAPERLFPNQFVLGSAYVEGLPGWRRAVVGGALKLTAHPGLRVTQRADAHASLTLLGFILDPLEPGAGDAAILERLLGEFRTFPDLLAAIARMGGRWVIIAMRDGQGWLFTDALGLRQVYHTKAMSPAGLWVASQPGMLAEVLNLPLDKEAQAFVESHYFRTDAEYRWPGRAGAYAGLAHLLPNHVLDLTSGEARRYWPDGPLVPLDREPAIERLAQRLPALVEAAAARFDLVLGLTAGWDSRLVLAASRALKERIGCITVRQREMPDDAVDLLTAARLSARLGLSHQVIKAPAATSAEFSYLSKRSVSFAHKHYESDAEAIYEFAHRGKVALTGSGAEVGRVSFRDQMPLARWRRPTSRDLARLQRMDGHPFAIRHFEEWLADVGDGHGISLLDLFEWEQGHGSWLAMTQLEFDSAWQDIFTPYNSREVLTTLLAVKENDRCKPRYRLFRELIERLWSEVLCEPINPVRRMTWLRRIARRVRTEYAKYRSIFATPGRA